MVSTESLQFAYTPAVQFRFPDICLTEGEPLLILGESGVGKTTFLHLLAGLLVAHSGRIELNGTNLSRLSSRKLDRFRGQHIGLVFQHPHFVQALSLVENLQLVRHLAHLPQDMNHLRKVLDSLGIGHKLHEKPYRLSQGEQQRAAIALAIINEPALILADEPTSSLDDKNCQRVAELLQEQATATGANLMIITHDQRLRSLFQNALTL